MSQSPTEPTSGANGRKAPRKSASQSPSRVEQQPKPQTPAAHAPRIRPTYRRVPPARKAPATVAPGVVQQQKPPTPVVDTRPKALTASKKPPAVVAPNAAATVAPKAPTTTTATAGNGSVPRPATRRWYQRLPLLDRRRSATNPVRPAAQPARSHRPSKVPHIPTRQGGAFDWFVDGLLRHRLGTLAALAASYTALLVSLWASVLGMILGVVVALNMMHHNSFTQLLFNAGASTSVSAVAVFFGALVGAGGGFVSFYTHTLAANPFTLFVGVFCGLLLGIVIVGIIAAFEGQLLAFRGYRPLTREEVRKVSPALQLMGAEYGLQHSPRFAIQESRAPAAFTHMRYIVLTTGLLDTLDQSQLTAVVGHELHHWKMGDSVGQHLVLACAWPIALLYNVASWLSNPHSKGGGPPIRVPGFLVALGWVIAWPAWFLMKFPIAIALRHDMRLHEYEADAAVKQLGYGPQLIEALGILSVYEGGRSGWEHALFATHPTYSQRIDKLVDFQPGDGDYVEPYLGAESARLVATTGAGVILFGGFVAWGAVLNAHRATQTPSTPTSATSTNSGGSTNENPVALSRQEVHDAEATASSFITQFIDNAYNKPAAEQVIARFVPATQDQQVFDSELDNIVGGLYGRDPGSVTSHAVAVACYLDPSATTANATASVYVDWASGFGQAQDQWFTQPVSMIRVGNRWTPTNGATSLPGVAGLYGDPSSIYLNPSPPSNYGNCPNA